MSLTESSGVQSTPDSSTQNTKYFDRQIRDVHVYIVQYHVVAALHAAGHATGELVDGDPGEEEEGDARPAGDEEPGQVSLGRAVRVWLAIRVSLSKTGCKMSQLKALL